MPELPDVETFRRYLDSTARRKQIRRVRVGDKKVLEGVSEKRLNDRLKRRRIDETRRHGKHLMVKAGSDQWMAVHFGMTGFLAYFRNNEDTPRHAHVIFDLANDYHLAYVASRKLGDIQLIRSPEKFIEREKLGPDALDDLDAGAFAEILKGRRGTIKSALMNQSIIAGIGNVYSDEIFYRAYLHPATEVKALSDEDLAKLWRRVRSVLSKAVEKQAQPDRLPRSWLVRRREEGTECGICDGTIVKRKFSGRGAYLCDKHQEKK